MSSLFTRRKYNSIYEQDRSFFPKRLEEQGGLNGVLLSFLIALGVGAAIFLPFLIVDKGFFTYCGDYNSQQIPFYKYVHDFLQTGGGTWSWATDLGSSVVNSYSFYNIGSPFLWLTLLFPSAWMPYLMVPLFLLKFGAIAAAACLYLSRYAKTRNMAVICSVVYAFCGFNVYNIFFNHMLDPVAIFPLMLWALDGYMYRRKRGWFALFVGLALLNSYFFFIGNVVFILLYFIVKLACGEYRIDLKNFSLLALEAVIGLGIGMVLALPAFYNLMDNPRTDNFANGMGLILYGNTQQYANILTSLFLPPDPPYMPNLFPDGAIKWTSMTAFLPIVGMGGVIAYCRGRRGGSTKILLGICLVMALVPILNSSFYAFNASYYARWFYMPILIMVLATLRSLEDRDIDLARGARTALFITAGIGVLGLLPVKKDDEWTLGIAGDATKFWLTVITGAAAALLFFIFVRYFRHKRRFAAMLLGAVMGFSVFYSVIHISLGKFPQWERDANYRAEQYLGSQELDKLLNDDGFYRVDVYYSGDAYDNLGLWMNRSNLYCFNSVITPSIMEFYPFVGVKRDVSSKPELKHYALRGLLSAKYMIMRTTQEHDFLAAEGSDGYVHYGQAGPFTVYLNENWLPLGFTYDEYIQMDHLETVRTDDRAPLLLRGIGLTGEQVAEYGHLFDGEAVEWVRPQQSSGTDDGETERTTGKTAGGWARYSAVSYEAYRGDVLMRGANASYETEYDASGFTARIRTHKDNLVFFAVPYDPGFTATVNGVQTEVLKVSSGMMAVYAPAGDNTIVFTYQTPGFAMGGVITLLSVAALALYLLLAWLLKRRRLKREAARLWRQNLPPGAPDESDGAAASIGIIGGSDGPTAIFWTREENPSPDAARMLVELPMETKRLPPLVESGHGVVAEGADEVVISEHFYAIKVPDVGPDAPEAPADGAADADNSEGEDGEE